MKRPDLSARNTTHGLSSLPEYKIWCGMKQRCYYTKHKSFAKYGAKGIKICERWLDFGNFYKDMGARPKGMTLDRIDINKDYSPENCKWSTSAEQMRNTSRTRFIEHNGIKKCLTDWAKEFGLRPGCLIVRASRGYTDMEILFGRGR